MSPPTRPDGTAPMHLADAAMPAPKRADLVLRALDTLGRPASAYEIIATLKDQVVLAPQTMYRALDRLIANGQVHKVESLNAYVVCRCDRHDLPAFAVCDSCGTATEFDLPEVKSHLASWSKKSGFSIATTTLELHGTCSSCQDGLTATAERK